MKTKFCPRCQTEKPVSEFYKRTRNKDGLRCWCKSCGIAATRQWQKENPEKEKAKRKKWYWENVERARSEAAQWQRENYERYRNNWNNWRNANREEYNKRNREYEREYRKNHPDKRAAIKHKRRAKKALNGGHFTAKEWRSLCAKYHHRCLACGKKKKLTVDHIIPIEKGGSSDISNIQPLCKPCNSSKGTRIIDYRLNYNHDA